MVKIINETPDPSVVKRTVCGNCACTLEYVPYDIQEDYSTDYTGGRDYYKYIKCPRCLHSVHVR
jgi:hypothetical protein